MWANAKAYDAKLEAEWNALPEKEKKRRREMYDPAFIERISDDILDDLSDYSSER